MLLAAAYPLYPETAETYGFKKMAISFLSNIIVCALIIDNVLVLRARWRNADEVHIDTDEANACNLADSGMMVWNYYKIVCELVSDKILIISPVNSIVIY